jgi:hypothetical protein
VHRNKERKLMNEEFEKFREGNGFHVTEKI